MSGDHPQRNAPSPAALAGLAALATLLITFQYTTLSKFGVLPPAQRHTALKTLMGQIALKVDLTRFDVLLALLILALFLALGVSHILKRSLSGIAEWCLASERRAVLALSLLAALSVRFYLAPGEISWAADSGPHLAYAWIACQSIAHGELPIWTNYLGTGTPFCQFYGFLFYYMTGFIHLIVRDVFLSMKLALGLGHILSGLSMYLLVRSRGIRRAYALVGALAYVLSFWHTQQSLVMGRFPVSWVYALLPLPFAFTSQLLRASQPSWRLVVPGAFALAAVTFTHPGYGFWSTVFLCVYGIGDLWASERIARLRGVISFGSLVLIGTLLGGYLWIPMVTERATTGLSDGFSLALLPDPHWSQLVFWSNYRYSPSGIYVKHWHGGYIGITILLMGVISLLPVGKRALKKRLLAPGLCLALALLLVFGYRWPLIRDLSIVQAFNAGRYILFVVFSLTLLLPEGLNRLHLILKRHRPRQVAIYALLILFVDLGPTTFQQPYSSGPAQHIMPENYLNQAEEALRSLPEGEIPNRRALYVSDVGGDYLNITWLMIKSGIPSILGVFDETLRATWGFTKPLKERLTTVLRKNPELQDSYDLVSALAFLLNNDLLYVDPDDLTIRRFEIPARSPIVVSGRSSHWADEFDLSNPISRGDLTDLLGRLRVDAGRLSVLELPILDGSPQTLSTDPSCRLIDHRVWNQRVFIRAEVDSACFARLAYSYYPYLNVTVDGRRVDVWDTATRFIAIRLEPGVHDIEITPFLSPLRKTLLGFNVGTILVYLGYVTRQRLKRRKKREG